MARLRRAIAEIEARSGPAERARRGAGLSLTRALDPALGGGLADDALHEIAPADAQDGAAAMGFALALAARFLSQRPASALSSAKASPPRNWARSMGRASSLTALPSAASCSCARPMRLGLLGDGGGAQMRRAGRGRGRDLELSRAIASPPRAACCSPREREGPRALLILASAYRRRRSASPAPPRRASRSPPRRAPHRPGGGRPRPARALRLRRAAHQGAPRSGGARGLSGFRRRRASSV